MVERVGNPASALASAVHPHFARHTSGSDRNGDLGIAPVPTLAEVEAIIQAAFWASLRREEGFDPKTSLAYLGPSHTPSPLRFARPFPLDIDVLTKLAPAVERPGIHLGVWDTGGQMGIWGTTRELPAYCFVAEVISPGLIVIKHSRREEVGKFVNVAVLEGDRIKVLNERAARVPDCPRMVPSLFGFEESAAGHEQNNVLIQLAVSMRAHERGGSLLVIPTGSGSWKHSVLSPLRYEISPAYSELAELVKLDVQERKKRVWQEAMRRAVAMIAGLTAVDGATIISDQYELLAFGAKIIAPDSAARVSEVLSTEPVIGSTPQRVGPSELGGTRHLSAAQFAQDQQDALALVASQDGRFTLFAWSPCEGLVQAHRVEALLL